MCLPWTRTCSAIVPPYVATSSAIMPVRNLGPRWVVGHWNKSKSDRDDRPCHVDDIVLRSTMDWATGGGVLAPNADGDVYTVRKPVVDIRSRPLEATHVYWPESQPRTSSTYS